MKLAALICALCPLRATALAHVVTALPLNEIAADVRSIASSAGLDRGGDNPTLVGSV